jgi:hypothetical protein
VVSVIDPYGRILGFLDRHSVIDQWWLLLQPEDGICALCARTVPILQLLYVEYLQS